MTAALILIATLASAGIVAYASFCRLTKTDEHTMTSVRLGIWMIAVSALAAIGAPFLWAWTPDAMHAALLMALAVHQLATRRTWTHGVPHWYTRAPACQK